MGARVECGEAVDCVEEDGERVLLGACREWMQ